MAPNSHQRRTNKHVSIATLSIQCLEENRPRSLTLNPGVEYQAATYSPNLNITQTKNPEMILQEELKYKVWDEQGDMWTPIDILDASPMWRQTNNVYIVDIRYFFAAVVYSETEEITIKRKQWRITKTVQNSERHGR